MQAVGPLAAIFLTAWPCAVAEMLRFLRQRDVLIIGRDVAGAAVPQA
ncbi:MAG: hypothetical protein ABI251_12350 [Mycobacteriaceae bacterium]